MDRRQRRLCTLLIRFLNVAFVAALVWLAYVAARIIFPDQVALRLGVLLLVASIPQNTFYGINNDVLSPICFGVTFICLVCWLRQDRPSVVLGRDQFLDRRHVPYEAE